MAKKTPKPPRHRRLSVLGDWAFIVREMDGGDDRTRAIVAAAYIENNLALAVISRLRPLDETGQNYLYDLEKNAALSDFASKIDLGWALNLYDEKVRDDLHRIRKIRNKFAHELDVRDFDHAAVRDYCDQLVGADYLDLPKGKTEHRSRRERYIDLAAHFGERFAMDSRKSYSPPPSPNKIRTDY